jgi:hypothetical protein
MRLVGRLALPALAIAALGCSDATAPRRLEQSYELNTVDGRTLPDEQVLISGVLVETTLWGSLWLHQDGTATMRTRTRRVDVGVDSLENTDSTTVAYRISGDSIEITNTVQSCGNLCDQEWHGTITSSGITIKSETLPEAAPVFHYIVTPERPT